jgi:hypothetical protein
MFFKKKGNNVFQKKVTMFFKKGNINVVKKGNNVFQKKKP